MFSGQIYSVEEDEIAALDVFQIPLKSLPKNSCTKCFGRFYTEFNLTHKHFIMCNKCAKKYIDLTRISKKK